MFIKKPSQTQGFLMDLQRPTFPARLQASIIGDEVLNFRVRNGNGWDHFSITTGNGCEL